MKFFHNALIVVGLVGGSVHAMDSQPELVDTVLELVWLHGGLDFDFDSLCAVARVRKNVRKLIVNSMKEREKVLENDYNKRLQEKEFDRGALLTLRKDRLAYGFIGVTILKEELCGHEERCELFLFRVTMDRWPNNVISLSCKPAVIIQIQGNPEPATEKYPWVENFKDPEQKVLRYFSAENFLGSLICIKKPYFKPNGDLMVERDNFKLPDGPVSIAELFLSTPSQTYEHTISDSGTSCCSLNSLVKNQ
jgi:hypothetical protein